MRLALALGAGLLVLGQFAQAGTRDEQLTQTIRDVQRAFARHSFELTPTTLQKLPVAQASDLFPSYGATPRVVPGLSWTLTALSIDQAVLCVLRTVQTPQAWNQALVAMSKAGLEPAVPSTCVSQPSQTLAPSSYPGTIAARVILDRQDTLSPTSVPVYPAVTGVDASAITRPGLELRAAEGPTTITLHNSNVTEVVGVAALTVRDGFTVAQSCGALAPESTCDITLSYNPVFGAYRVAQLRIEFTNGEVASIGLLGTP